MSFVNKPLENSGKHKDGFVNPSCGQRGRNCSKMGEPILWALNGLKIVQTVCWWSQRNVLHIFHEHIFHQQTICTLEVEVAASRYTKSRVCLSSLRQRRLPPFVVVKMQESATFWRIVHPPCATHHGKWSCPWTAACLPRSRHPGTQHGNDLGRHEPGTHKISQWLQEPAHTSTHGTILRSTQNHAYYMLIALQEQKRVGGGKGLLPSLVLRKWGREWY